MSKKDLASVTTDLSALASMMPTQRPAAVPEPQVLRVALAPPVPKPKGQGEEITQFSLSLRKDLRKQLARLADDADMTMRAFVLNALKDKGLDVHADDLADLRKERQ
jgi:hypothetical protein